MAINICNSVITRVFNEGPYTSLKMMEVIVSTLELSPGDILVAPELLRAYPREAVTETNFRIPPISTIWKSETGRCTSFAVKVAEELNGSLADGTSFAFRYFDARGHRVARCENTNILVDSLSEDGAQVLLPGQNWVNCNGDRGRWKIIDGISKYETRDGVPLVLDCISAADGLSSCMVDVAQKAQLVCLFR